MSQFKREFAGTYESKMKNPFSRGTDEDLADTENSPFTQILHLQKTFGNRMVSQWVQSGTIQTKLKIDRSDNVFEFEQEAERAAEKVMRMAGPERNESSNLVHRSLPYESVIQRQDPPNKVKKQLTAAEKAELELGQKLWDGFPAGVNVAFYDRSEAVFGNRANAWAVREKAIAAKAKPISAQNLVFDKAFPDDYDVKDTLPALGKVLVGAVNRAGQPKNIQPLPGTGPSLVRTLAIFSHGTPTWLGIGSDITKGNVSAVIKSIAPTLTTDVNVILYACGTARSPGEKEEWASGTLGRGGAKSLSALIRDALVEEGAKGSAVWGHTTTGHTTENFALRIFYGAHGKGSEGTSYVENFVFGTVAEVIALLEVEREITDRGYYIEPDQGNAFRWEVYRRLSGSGLKSLFYRCYSRANVNLKYKGVYLAEMAPTDPLGVSDVISNYWENTFWPAERPKLVNDLIKSFKLKKLPPP